MSQLNIKLDDAKKTLLAAQNKVLECEKILAVENLIKAHIQYALLNLSPGRSHVIDLPRGIGKTAAFNSLKEEKISGVFFFEGHFTCHRGKRLPYGEDVRLIVVDDNHHLFIRLVEDSLRDWIVYGYKVLPIFIHITTLQKKF